MFTDLTSLSETSVTICTTSPLNMLNSNNPINSRSMAFQVVRQIQSVYDLDSRPVNVFPLRSICVITGDLKHLFLYMYMYTHFKKPLCQNAIIIILSFMHSHFISESMDYLWRTLWCVWRPISTTSTRE